MECVKIFESIRGVVLGVACSLWFLSSPRQGWAPSEIPEGWRIAFLLLSLPTGLLGVVLAVLRYANLGQRVRTRIDKGLCLHCGFAYAKDEARIGERVMCSECGAKNVVLPELSEAL